MKNIFKFLVVITLIFSASKSYAQKRDVDALLKNAQQEANVNKNYKKAIGLAEEAINLAPAYTDVRLLLGRLYLLTNQFDKARTQLAEVHRQLPNNGDALNYLITVEELSGNIERAIYYANIALEGNYRDDLVIRKASLYEAAGNDQRAYQTLSPLLPGSAANDKVRNYYRDLKLNAAIGFFRQGYPDSARLEFLEVRAVDPGNERAINELFALADQEKSYEEALAWADSGLRYFPASENFLFKKAAVLGSLNRPMEAYPVAVELAEKYPENERARSMVNDLYVVSRQNRVGINYSYTFFDPNSTRPWNMGSIFYLREEKYASVGARINYADRGFTGGRGYQFEIEAYPKHRNGYSFVNMAYSNSNIFPAFRLGYSLYQDLNNGWEGEAAVRVLQAGGRDFYTIGGSIGRYAGKYWVSIRPFLTTFRGELFASGALNMRRYFEDRDSYIYAVLGAGTSPDDRGRQFEFDSRIDLSSYNVGAGVQKLIFRTNIAGVGFSYNRQELVSGKKRNEFDVNLSWHYRF